MEQPKKIGTEWILSENGKYVGSMSEDDEGRAVVDCRTLLPPSPYPSLFLLEMAPVQEAGEEVMVTAVAVELLHRRMGRMGSATLTQLGRDDFVGKRVKNLTVGPRL